MADRAGPIDPLVAEIRRRRIERGWTQTELASRTGVSTSAISATERGLQGHTLYTLRLLAAAFELEVVLRPRSDPRPRRRQTGGHLLSAPKARDPNIDPVAVERACRGEPVTLSIAERGEAVRRLTGRGLSARAIAERLRLAQRTVVRYRGGQVRHARPQPVDSVGEAA